MPRPNPPILSLIAALIAALGSVAPLSAQQSYYGQTSAGLPGANTGRDFAGTRLPSSLQVGDVTIRAARAWVWTEGASGSARVVGADGLPVGTQRLMLQGDVVVELGAYRFTAAQAVVWSQNLTSEPAASGAAGDRQTRQIAVYFDRVADPGAPAGYAQAADRLLVTARLEGTFALQADAITPGRPVAPVTPGSSSFLAESEQRLQRHLRELAGETLGPETTPGGLAGPVSDINPGLSRPYEPNSPLARRRSADEPDADASPIPTRVEPLFARDGIITFAVGTRAPDAPTAPEFGERVGDGNYIRLVRGEDGADNTLLLTGGVAVQYTDLRKTRNLLITAERAVAFLPPGPLTDLGRFGSEQIRGIYLEGDVVATDGQYTLRGPRVYYDFAANKAVMADAVFSAIDARTGLPMYIRAATLRQEAANQVTAEGARLSTSSFFNPVFAIGASSVTVTQVPSKRDGNRTVSYIEAKNITLRASDVPLFWFPGFKGELDQMPLQDIRVENSSGSGAALKTSWDIFGLLNTRPPAGLKANLLLDYYFDRGFAAGGRADWTREGLAGQAFAYMLTSDDGRDVLSNGFRKEQDEQFRGIVLAQNRWDIDAHWSLFAQVAKISDSTFVDGFFRDLASEGRELTTSVLLRYTDSNSQFTLGAKGALNDFTANQYLLQSQGYMVDKLPEATYSRLADDLLPGIEPGMLTWTHEYQIARVGFRFNEPTADDFGFTNSFVSQKEFGVAPTQSLGDRFRAAGLNESPVGRADTRQEIAGVFDWGVLRINPFIVGRFTAYDQKIEEFSAFSPDGDKQYRAWYGGGSRFSTEIVRIDDGVESSFFDLHRIRHIVTPSATVWTAGSSIREESLPIFDDSVEALATGSAVRTGVAQTWQTQRGGPGRWRSVDVFRLNTDVTFATADRNNGGPFNGPAQGGNSSPFGRFFDARPEYSFLGNYFTGEAAWQVTDAVALASSVIYDFDTGQIARATAGGIIQHSPEFSIYAQVRSLNALDAVYVDAGTGYQLTRLYSLSAGVTYDTNRNEVQNFSATLRRRFQDASLGVRMNFNNITDETSIGVVFEPAAAAAARLHGSEQLDRLRDVGR